MEKLTSAVHSAPLENGRRQSIYCASALHRGPRAKAMRADQFQGLEAELWTAVGAPMMLRTNLATALGLVNGVVGEVYDILVSEDFKEPSLPIVLMAFPREKVKCPGVFEHPDPEKAASTVIIPIRPVTREAVGQGGKICTRTQLPLVLAHALTVHKAQGLTLAKAAIDMGDAETSSGWTFTALSRVRALEDLVLLGALDLERLEKVDIAKRLLKRRHYESTCCADAEAAFRQWLDDLDVPPLSRWAAYDTPRAGN